MRQDINTQQNILKEVSWFSITLIYLTINNAQMVTSGMSNCKKSEAELKKTSYIYLFLLIFKIKYLINVFFTTPSDFSLNCFYLTSYQSRNLTCIDPAPADTTFPYMNPGQNTSLQHKLEPRPHPPTLQCERAKRWLDENHYSNEVTSSSRALIGGNPVATAAHHFLSGWWRS